VNLKVGGPDISPEQVVAGSRPSSASTGLPSLLAQRDTGNESGEYRAGLHPQWHDRGHVEGQRNQLDPEDEGQEIRVWIFGNEFEQEAALVKAGLDPKKDVTLVSRTSTMVAFLKREIDAASAMTYNELARSRDGKPKTGQLYTAQRPERVQESTLGTGNAPGRESSWRGDWIKSKANQALSVKLLTASLKGWAYCRDHFKECVNIVVANGTALPKGHQTCR